jgi:chemotaxis protein MotB
MTTGLNRSAWLLSFMVPVFLSACANDDGVSQAEYERVVTQNQQLQSQNEQLQEQAAADQARISRLQSAVKYTVNSDLLFPSGGYELTEAGKETIAKVAQILAPEQQERLVVNGYTDNAPVGPSLQQKGITSNQMLSELRANAVMNYMISQGVKPEFLSAQGWGEADPIATNSTASGRAQNRRVEITIAGS